MKRNNRDLQIPIELEQRRARLYWDMPQAWRVYLILLIVGPAVFDELLAKLYP